MGTAGKRSTSSSGNGTTTEAGIRANTTLKNANRTNFWLRWTACFRRIDGNWLIAHDQVSVPVDPESGRALLNLEP